MFVFPFVTQAMASGGVGGFDFMGILPIVLMFGVFYFMLIRPQQKKEKLRQLMLKNLRKGDKVLTSGGIMGTVEKVVNDNEVSVEISDGVVVKFARNYIIDNLSRPDVSEEQKVEGIAKVASSRKVAKSK
jgi:preprotein translocase subunit YajC